MAPVAGQPFLGRLLTELETQGYARVVLAVGYRRESIVEYFGERFHTVQLAYSVEEKLLGTGGAIRQALAMTDAPVVLVLNGDSWLDCDFSAMLEQHTRLDATITLAAVHVPDIGRYGALQLEGDHVEAFAEKGGRGPGWINGGVYLVSRCVESMMDCAGAFSFEADFLVPRIADLRPVAFRCAGAFVDIGVPKDYALAQRMFASK